MTIATIRAAVGDELPSSLRFHATVPDNPTPPFAFCGLASGRYKDDFEGHFTFTLPLYVVVGLGAGNPRAVEKLDGYIDRTGTDSVFAALDGSNLSGACHWLAVVDFTEGLAPPFDFLNADYLGATFTLEIGA